MKFIQLHARLSQKRISVRAEDVFRIEEADHGYSKIIVDNHRGGTEEIECYEQYDTVMNAMVR